MVTLKKIKPWYFLTDFALTVHIVKCETHFDNILTKATLREIVCLSVIRKEFACHIKIFLPVV